VEDRELVKAALRTVYAKSREEQVNFDRVFDGFFLPEEVIRARNEYLASEVRRQHQRAEEDLQFNGQPMAFTQEQKLAYGALDEKERQRLQGILEKYGENAAVFHTNVGVFLGNIALDLGFRGIISAPLVEVAVFAHKAFRVIIDLHDDREII
jgi:uncharacterized protein with von Willebrand factor type A (vWA) domain